MWHERLRDVPTYFNQIRGDLGGGLQRCAMGFLVDDSPYTRQLEVMEKAQAWIKPNDVKVMMFCPMTKCPAPGLIHHYLSSLVVHLNDEHYLLFGEIADVIQPIEEEFRQDPDEDKDIDAEAPKSNTPEKELIPA